MSHGKAAARDICERFRLDYYLDEGHQRPEHRYCVCGWTEAHHSPLLIGSRDTEAVRLIDPREGDT